MKHLLKNLIKGLLVIVLFTGSTIALTSAGVKTVSEANATTCQVTTQQVWNYLTNHGYIVYSVVLISGTNNFACTTQLQGVNYNTTVYTDGISKVVEVISTPM